MLIARSHSAAIVQHEIRLKAKRRCIDFEQVTKKAFKEILEPEALVELGLITSPQNFKVKEIKANTKLFYTQTK